MRYSRLLVYIIGVVFFSRAQVGRAEEVPAPAAPALPEVVVRGQEDPDSKKAASYRPETPAVSKVGEKLLETPQTVTVVPKQVLDDQGATTLRESLRNVTGISLAAGEGGNQGDNLTIRGFTARSDLFLDGMRDFGNYYRDSFNYQQVEAIKGPASLAFGRGSTGGVINQQSKVPHLTTAVDGSLAVGTNSTRRATVDVNQPLPSVDEHAALRLNLVAHESNVTGRAVVENHRLGLAPSLAFGLGTSTRTTVSYFHLAGNDVPDYGIPFLLGEPAPVSRDNYYGFKNSNYLKTGVDVFTFRVERDFNSQLTLREQLRYGHYDRDIQVTEARVAASVTAATPLDSISVTRNQIVASGTETTLDNDLSLTAKFDTGGIGHRLTWGFEAIRETSNPRRFAFTGVPGTNLLTPNMAQAFAGTSALSSQVEASVTTFAPYLLDTVALGEHFDLILGVRYDWAESKYQQFIGTLADLRRVDRMASWRGGLVYKPVTEGSIYFSYGTSFNPSAEQLSLSSSTANLDPEQSRVFELGTKWDLLEKRLGVQVAGFLDEKVNARTPDPNNSALNVLSGKHRVTGAEFGVTGSVSNRWQLFTGYTYLSGEVVASNRAGETGRPLANTPKHTGTLWATYQATSRWQLGGGFKGVSPRRASTTPSSISGLMDEVPGYWTFDLLAKVQLSSEIDLQLNVYNLTNAYFIEGIHPGHVVPGEGRSGLLTAHFKL